MAVTLERGARRRPPRLIELLVVHDLGEAVLGDVPAPLQAGDKTADERATSPSCSRALPAPAAERLMARWDEYTRRRHARRRGSPRASTGSRR